MSYLIRVAEAPLSAGGYDLHRSASLLAGRIVDEISITPCETRPSLVRVTVELDPWQKPEGKADSFLETGLKPWLFEEAIKGTDIGLTLRMHERYDHSYYFISTFMDDHLKWHAERLG